MQTFFGKLRILIKWALVADFKNNFIGRDNMQEERLQVLKMVEDGKITVDESIKLLEALKGGPSGPGLEEKFNNFAKETKEFFKDVGKKVNEMYKGAEPKIKEATKKVAAKTAEVADSISQSINEKIKKAEEAGCCSDSAESADLGDEQKPPADNGPAPN
jgi:gas vesicle protein